MLLCAINMKINTNILNEGRYKGLHLATALYDSRKSTRASSCTSFTAIQFNSKTITDGGDQLEYYMKTLSQSIQRK